jgi:hypothetical protein
MHILIIAQIDATPTPLMESIVSPKRWKQQKDKELGHAFWLITLWGYGGVLELQDGG